MKQTVNVIPERPARMLREVLEHLKSDPRRLYMSFWVVNSRRLDSEKLQSDALRVQNLNGSFPDCGTAGCMGGWIVLKHGSPEQAEQIYCNPWSTPEVAAELLGMDYDYERDALEEDKKPGEVRNLFSRELWPLDFQHAYNKAKTPEARLEVTGLRTEHFILTGF